jgi:hypothetical protein
MNKWLTVLMIISCITVRMQAQASLDQVLPVRGICLSAPKPDSLNKFIRFIKEELVPLRVNTLVILIDYSYTFKSHPELIAPDPLSNQDIKKIVKACHEGGISIIPQINLLGHQSWFQQVGQLLKAYPQFNETPHVPTTGGSTNMKWPNEWGLYCLSYCPLHPDVHKVVFDVVDEIVEAFEAKAFHAGMDEVFYLGDEKCPRCQGKDKAELFAGEVTAIRNHLAEKNIELWIWGDRLLDGKTTGIGLWEASYNSTYRAIDMIPKDVVINDWHYERPDPTAIYFALKGFKVITCPWRFPDISKTQLQIVLDGKKYATPAVKGNYLGVLHTTWTSAEDFIDQYYGRKEVNTGRGGNYVTAFKALFDEINKLDVKK